MAPKSVTKGVEEEKLRWSNYYDKEPSLLQIQNMVTALRNTTSQLQKKEILKAHIPCVRILRYVYDPYWQFHVTSSNVEKNFNNEKIRMIGRPSNSIFHLMDMLKDGKISGHMAIGTVIVFVERNKKFKELIYAILDKNLKIRCNDATINKVFPDLIPGFAVALAHPFEQKMNIPFETEEWDESRKLDGVRVIAVCNSPDHIEFLSREGNEFTTLGVVRKQLTSLGLSGVVLDGEVCIIMESGAENFKQVVGDIKKKNYEIPNPRYFVFDMLTIDEFQSKISNPVNRRLSDRRQQLSEVVGKKLEPTVVMVEQNRIQNVAHLQELTSMACAKGWEGLILRKNIGYEGKRSKNMLKVKKFQEEEFVVDSIEMGTMRFIKNHQDAEVETMASVVIYLQPGCPVHVGSGFTPEERDMFAKDPSMIVGKTITVSYFERTEDKNGKPSLRFPTFRALWGYKRNI